PKMLDHDDTANANITPSSFIFASTSELRARTQATKCQRRQLSTPKPQGHQLSREFLPFLKQKEEVATEKLLALSTKVRRRGMPPPLKMFTSRVDFARLQLEKMARAYAHVYDHYFGAGRSSYSATAH
ncbi:MAG: hypothetical protein ABJA83_13335, partial [Burkholderiaceae bacterium]